MLVFLRWIGITNAAVWFGAGIFYIFCAEPAFTSNAMSRILPPSHSGAAANLMLADYFKLQCWCGGIAVTHLLVECWYAGRPIHKWVIALLFGLILWTAVGSFFLSPRLSRLHIERYGVRSTPAQRFQAERSYRIWHAVLETCNVLANAGLIIFVLERSSSMTLPRFVSANKFRG